VFYVAIIWPTIVAIIIGIVLVTTAIIIDPPMPDPPTIVIPDPDPTSEFPPPIIVVPVPDGTKDTQGKKAGGLDPLVVGKWHYNTVETERCESPRSFDYDNDFELENFCYEIIGNIFVVDFHDGEGISHGYNMLNFYRTNLYDYTPYEYLKEFPNLCDVYSCYLWNDSTRDWKVDDGELTPYRLEIIHWQDHPKGMNLYTDEEGIHRYIYGAGTNKIDNTNIVALQPTYWTMKNSLKVN